MSETKVNLSAVYGVKAGMTRIFDDSGKNVPVTVIKLIPNVISQVKTLEKDGYTAYQVAYGEKREKLVTTPVKGHLKKAGVDKMFTKFAEFKATEISEENLGKEVSTEEFAAQTFVDVTGTTKGKGFAGVMKRYNFSGGPGAHGSKFHRTTGSIGNRATPGRVFKQKKMPGHMGDKTKTVQNLQIVELNEEQGYMLIKGSVPGSKNGFVRIAKAHKK
ncbi:MAG: 50S ribosomal protein L3 [Bacteriovoracaceae bacterium]|jgi:large subunit ribosomal protein L3|nr:50S ribosomal protein L3 [Bacteriovoracaceae bacterium]